MAKTRNAFSEFFGIFASATAAAAAIENGRPARARDLRRLGIDPEAFRSIGR